MCATSSPTNSAMRAILSTVRRRRPRPLDTEVPHVPELLSTTSHSVISPNGALR